MNAIRSRPFVFTRVFLYDVFCSSSIHFYVFNRKLTRSSICVRVGRYAIVLRQEKFPKYLTVEMWVVFSFSWDSTSLGNAAALNLLSHFLSCGFTLSAKESNSRQNTIKVLPECHLKKLWEFIIEVREKLKKYFRQGSKWS